MLKQRILSAVIAVPLLCVLIVWSPVSLFSAVLLGLALWAAWEWTHLVRFETLQRWGFLGLVLAALLALYLSAPRPQLLFWICAGALFCWLAGFGLVFAFSWFQQRAFSRLVRQLSCFIVGLVLILPFVVGIYSLKSAGREDMLLFLLFLIWIADSAAYFGGRSLGRHRLAPVVSPGKTWEGFVCSALAGGVFGMLAMGWLHVSIAVAGWVALVVFIVVVSALGDLFESGIKRLMGVKDSGRGLPGHGGILDRIDSLTAAVPFFVVGYSVLLNGVA